MLSSSSDVVLAAVGAAEAAVCDLCKVLGCFDFFLKKKRIPFEMLGFSEGY